MDETILVQELGQLLEFSYTDMPCYAGPFSRAGVASALKVLQRAFAALSPIKSEEPFFQLVEKWRRLAANATGTRALMRVPSPMCSVS